MTDQTRDIVERHIDDLAKAYIAGATDVHVYWRAGGSNTEPDFAEAARDYARDAIEPGHIEALTKRVAELEEALKRIAEGNLGSMPWQADYAKIREVASAALSNAARGEEG
jgi:CO/xanthine dehydrogenase Mo-binding subunit